MWSENQHQILFLLLNLSSKLLSWRHGLLLGRVLVALVLVLHLFLRQLVLDMVVLLGLLLSRVLVAFVLVLRLLLRWAVLDVL